MTRATLLTLLAISGCAAVPARAALMFPRRHDIEQGQSEAAAGIATEPFILRAGKVMDDRFEIGEQSLGIACVGVLPGKLLKAGLRDGAPNEFEAIAGAEPIDLGSLVVTARSRFEFDHHPLLSAHFVAPHNVRFEQVFLSDVNQSRRVRTCNQPSNAEFK